MKNGKVRTHYVHTANWRGQSIFFFLREGDNREKTRVERNKKNEGEKLTFVVYKPPTSIEIYEVGGCVRLCLIYINHTEIIGTLLDQLKIKHITQAISDI